jgi:hypothetical protein
MDPNEPGRLPSDRPEPCGPGGQDALTVRVRSLARHPVACREPAPASSKTDWSLQAIPTAALPASSRPRVLRHAHAALHADVHGERCFFPTSATDLRPRAPSTDHPIPESEPSGEASLDGDPPASAIVDDPVPTGARSRSPGRSSGRGRRTVLVELRSVAPPCCASRPRRCRPRTEIVT